MASSRTSFGRPGCISNLPGNDSRGEAAPILMRDVGPSHDQIAFLSSILRVREHCTADLGDSIHLEPEPCCGTVRPFS